jgi:hypothetical protein
VDPLGLLREFGSLLDEQSNNTTSVEGKRQHWLKRAIIVRRAEQEDYRDVGLNIPVELLHHILVGLGERARRERHYHIPQQQQHNTAAPEVKEKEAASVMRCRIDTYDNRTGLLLA